MIELVNVFDIDLVCWWWLLHYFVLSSLSENLNTISWWWVIAIFRRNTNFHFLACTLWWLLFRNLLLLFFNVHFKQMTAKHSNLIIDFALKLCDILGQFQLNCLYSLFIFKNHYFQSKPCCTNSVYFNRNSMAS